MKSFNVLYQDYEEIFTNIHLSFEDWCLDLKDYAKDENDNLININDSFNLCKIIRKHDNKNFMAQIIEFTKTNFEFDPNLPFWEYICFLGNINCNIQHCSLLKFIGLSPIDFNGNHLPVVITEETPNGSLYDFLKHEKEFCNPNWNSAKKLINIYGIASAMVRLHSNQFIMQNISTKSILLDENLYPKLFGLLSFNNNEKDKNEIVDNIMYLSPEKYSNESDMYSFSLLIYEIMTNEELFQIQSNIKDVISKKLHQKLNSKLPDCYIKLIQNCLSTDSIIKLEFTDIIKILRTPDFINNLDSKEQKEEYFRYIYSLDPKDFFNISIYSKLFKIKNGLDFELYKAQQEKNKKLYSAKSYKLNEQHLKDEYKRHIYLDKVLSELKHPAFLKYKGYSLFNFEYENYLTVFNEYQEHSLYDVLSLERKKSELEGFNLTKKIIIIYGIASGMKYLHLKGFIHRSLSSSKIFLNKDFYPKISQFDYIQQSDVLLKDNYVNRIEYLDPCIIDDLKYEKSSDVYAFAILMYEIFTNENPFKGFQSYIQVLRAVQNGYRPKFNSKIPNCYQRLIETCWDANPDNRYSFSTIVHMLETDEKFYEPYVNVKQYKEYIEMIEDYFKSKYRMFYNLANELPQIDINDYENPKHMFSENHLIYMTIKQKGEKTSYIGRFFEKEIYELSEDLAISLLKDAEMMHTLNKHPSSIKLIGFCPVDFNGCNKPVIVTEFYNDYLRLNNFIKYHSNLPSHPGWNSTMKLINIFGIASMMQYLISNKIKVNNFSTSNFVLDSFLYSKFVDFKYCEEIYSDIEAIEEEEVLQFSFIIYEIVTNHKMIKINPDSNRPVIEEYIPQCYKYLIDKCWYSNSNAHTTFSDIIELLKSPSFTCILENEKQKQKYFNYVYSIESKFNNSKKYLNIVNYILGYPINESKRITVMEINTCELYIAEFSEDKYSEYNKFNEILSAIDHPSILKYIGYFLYNLDFEPCLTILFEPCLITDFDQQPEPLYIILFLESIGAQQDGWTFTKKLINIFGIASGMEYLHSKNIVHCSLTTKNILYDKNFYPKISGFLEMQTESYSNIKKLDHLMNYPVYIAPEFYKSNIYEKPCDVYAFSIIMYEILISEQIFPDYYSPEQISYEMINGYRPKLNYNIPECYLNLIESCWLEDPKKRPTFSDIVKELRTNPEFITSYVDKTEFISYVSNIQAIYKNSDSSNICKKSDEIQFIDINNYERLNKIGGGGFANIFTVRDKKTNELFAAKIMINDKDDLSEDEEAIIKREMKILFQLKHPAIIKAIGYSPVNFKYKQRPVFILELAKGSLFDILELERKGIAPAEWNSTKKHINIFGIALGMEYIHSLNIIHRDLKPANVLEDEYMFPKITDFGLSKRINQNYDSISFISGEGLKGTYTYMSPEVIMNQDYSKACDVYSFGLIVYEIITGEEPFKNLQMFALIKFVMDKKRPDINSYVPQCYKNLIEKCWADEPAKRPTFSQIVKLLQEDEFLDKLQDKEEFLNYVDYAMNNNNSSSNDYNFRKVQSDIKIKKEMSDIEVPSNVMQIDLTQFEKQDKLGAGGFARVYKVINKESNLIPDIFTTAVEFPD